MLTRMGAWQYVGPLAKIGAHASGTQCKLAENHYTETVKMDHVLFCALCFDI